MSNALNALNVVKLNLGAGSRPLPGYINVNRMYDDGLSGKTCQEWKEENGLLLYSAHAYPLRNGINRFSCLDDSIDEVRASHVLEHFPRLMLAVVLSDWVRVLKPGGWLKIAVPDFRYIAEKYLNGDESEPLEAYCMGGQVDQNDFHHCIFDERLLRNAFEHLGLVDVQRWKSEINDCASLPVSLNLMGRKPLPGEDVETDNPQESAIAVIDGWRLVHDIEPREGPFACLNYRRYTMKIAPLGQKRHRGFIAAPDGSTIQAIDDFECADDAFRVAKETIDSIVDTAQLLDHPDPKYADVQIAPGSMLAVETCPRLGFTSHMSCAMKALRQFGIDFVQQGGAFWHQGLETLLEQAVESGAKYVLTLDFDTVFDARDVQTLYGIMESRPDIAALFPVQSRREVMSALFTVKGENGENLPFVDRKQFDGDVTVAHTGHFGLTIIRTDALKQLQKPWLHAQPDENGRWGDGRVDADIMFWKRLESAGMRVCLANRVVVGHIEQVVTWPDVNLQPFVQYSSDNHKDGRPSKAGSPIWR